MAFYCAADDRSVIAVKGADARPFLQGLISNDVDGLGADEARWSAFLTAQGKYLHDFFVLPFGDDILLECERARAQDLMRRLAPYRLRSDVQLENWGDSWRVALVWGDGAAKAAGLAADAGKAGPFAGGLAYVDPRKADLGVRIAAPSASIAASVKASGAQPANHENWDALRIALALPDGARDLEVGKSVLLENGFDELRGVDWDKGCYLGQELTARTRYRGLVKKRLAPFRIEGVAPPRGARLMLQDRDVGEMRSVAGDIGLALVKRDAIFAMTDETVERPPMLRWEKTRLSPELPAWLEFLMESMD